jgi:hypothetical protein
MNALESVAPVALRLVVEALSAERFVVEALIAANKVAVALSKKAFVA